MNEGAKGVVFHVFPMIQVEHLEECFLLHYKKREKAKRFFENSHAALDAVSEPSEDQSRDTNSGPPLKR